MHYITNINLLHIQICTTYYIVYLYNHYTPTKAISILESGESSESKSKHPSYTLFLSCIRDRLNTEQFTKYAHL